MPDEPLETIDVRNNRESKAGASDGVTRLARASDGGSPPRDAPGAEETAMAALSDPEVEVRQAAVQVLARVAGPRGVRAIMETAIRDPAPAVRAEAVAALGRIVGHGMEPRSSS